MPLPAQARSGRKLPKQQTGDSGPAADRFGSIKVAPKAPQRRSEAVVADDAAVVMSHDDGGGTLLLVGESSRSQPMIESRLPAGKRGNVVRGRQRLRK